jgi:pyruvate/2-oxoglutarate dehydrogenase complex dihydrolipoamide dehydrogenase (E3) component
VTHFTRRFASVDRARTDDTTDGFVRILVRQGSDQIVGATIVGAHAGELISEVATAMAARMGLASLANVIHPYPTLAEAIRQCGDDYNRTRLTASARTWIDRWLRWNRNR